MNLKFYLRGLGLGLIVTTIILSVSRNFGSGQDKENNDVSQTQNSTGSVIAFTRGQEETTVSGENETRQEETTNQTEPSKEALTQPETTKAAEPETTSKAVEPTTQEPTKAPEENGSVPIVIKDVYYRLQHMPDNISICEYPYSSGLKCPCIKLVFTTNSDMLIISIFPNERW